MKKKIMVMAVMAATVVATAGCGSKTTSGATTSENVQTTTPIETTTTQAETTTQAASQAETTTQVQTTTQAASQAETTTQAQTTTQAASQAETTTQAQTTTQAETTTQAQTTTQAGTADSSRQAAAYIGNYSYGRASLGISDNGNGTYTGVITWADSAFAYTEWIYDLTYDANSGKMVCNGNATKVYFEYLEGNSRAVDTIMYNNGTGSFELSNGAILWHDDVENMGADAVFTPAQAETSAGASASQSSAAAYIGSFSCGRASLGISDNGNGTYTGVITWADSAFAYTEWIYDLVYDTNTGKMVCNGGATKVYFEYLEGNSRPVDTVMYSNGTGSFELSNGAILWHDDMENSGADMEFVG